MPWGRRPDGDRVEGLSHVRRMMPFLMRSKVESLVYFEQDIDVERGVRWLQTFHDVTGVKATWLHLLIWAIAATVGDRPRLNRFIGGHRLYQRRGIWISFSGKKAKSDAHPLVTVKMRVEPDETPADLAPRIAAAIGEARSDRESTTDRELKWLLRIPGWLLGPLVSLTRRLDAWGLLPRAFIDSDPLFASAFIANLGSIDMDAGFHHLFEYGNIPLFCTAGRAQPKVVPGPDGTPVVAMRMTLRWTYDERVEDGLYCARALELLRQRLENPGHWLDDAGRTRSAVPGEA